MNSYYRFGSSMFHLQEINAEATSVSKKRKDSITHEVFCNNYKLSNLYFLSSKEASFLFEKMAIITVLALPMLAAVASSQNGNYFI